MGCGRGLCGQPFQPRPAGPVGLTDGPGQDLLHASTESECWVLEPTSRETAPLVFLVSVWTWRGSYLRLNQTLSLPTIQGGGGSTLMETHPKVPSPAVSGVWFDASGFGSRFQGRRLGCWMRMAQPSRALEQRSCAFTRTNANEHTTILHPQRHGLNRTDLQRCSGPPPPPCTNHAPLGSRKDAAGHVGRRRVARESRRGRGGGKRTDVATHTVALEPLLPPFGSLHVRARPPELRGGHLADVLGAPDHASPDPARVVLQDQRSGAVRRAMDVIRALSALGMREGSKVRLAPACSHRDLWPHAQHLAMVRIRSLVCGTQSVQCAEPIMGGRCEESKAGKVFCCHAGPRGARVERDAHVRVVLRVRPGPRSRRVRHLATGSTGGLCSSRRMTPPSPHLSRWSPESEECRQTKLTSNPRVRRPVHGRQPCGALVRRRLAEGQGLGAGRGGGGRGGGGMRNEEKN